MPAADVSDLRDVFDAIDRLCETMRTSTYEEAEECVEARYVECREELAGPEEVAVCRVEAHRAERWTDADTGASDTEPAALSEYYTASSEVSLLSDEADTRDGKECIAGHVAAMRERFESMTRTNTPCPDTDVSGAVTPSSD